LKWILKDMGHDCVDWIYLAQDRDQWWALVKTVMNLRVPLEAMNSLTNWETVVSEKQFFMELIMCEQAT